MNRENHEEKDDQAKRATAAKMGRTDVIVTADDVLPRRVPHPGTDGGGQPPAEPPLSAEAREWIPFVSEVIETAPRVEAELPRNKLPKKPNYIGRPK
jgi:hypothetical protein